MDAALGGPAKREAPGEAWGNMFRKKSHRSGLQRRRARVQLLCAGVLALAAGGRLDFAQAQGLTAERLSQLQDDLALFTPAASARTVDDLSKMCGAACAGARHRAAIDALAAQTTRCGRRLRYEPV